MTMPIICTRSMNLSLGFRPVIISKSKNNKWPPSSAGIGRMFIKARMTEIKAVIDQKLYQSHCAGNKLAIVPKPPMEVAPSFVNMYLKSLT